MEVTRNNFQEVLTELDEILKDASFLGIDGEFTGLNSGPDAGAFDTPAQYYTKLRAGSMDFLLVQFGLSVFTFDTETQKYTQRSYNFYIFPRPLNRAAPDSRFMCQASCISFLVSQGFDFNKLFTLGIPYLTTSEEEKLVKRLEERQKARDEVPELIPIPDDDQPQIEEICSRIDEFITSDAEKLTIDKCNAFIRRLVHQEVRIRWPNKLRVESKSDCSGHSLVVQRSGTKEEEEQKETERRDRELMEIKQAVGLSALLKKISESRKLIVGHNMLLDLCHIIHKFFGPLPESYFEFKSLVHTLFPRILDTKVLCQSQQFKENVPSSNLNVLLERVSKPPFKVPEVETVTGRSYSTLTEKCHEAGYDAYITGVCFIALCNYLGSLQKPEIPIVLANSHLLNPFINKLLIARLKDYPYVSLVGKDPNPSRDHVFHITFPKDWKLGDISQLFSPFGGVYVSWLSDTSAYVALNRREQANSVAKNLCKASTYRIQKYVEHQVSLELNHNTGDRKRKLSSSEPGATRTENNNSASTNAAKTIQNDDGWEVATGNELKLSSERITHSPNPHERSRNSFKSRGRNHEVVESLFQETKVAQKVSPNCNLRLSANIRNGRKKDTVPKYTVLRRDMELDLNNEVETSNVLRITEIRLCNMANPSDSNDAARESGNDCNGERLGNDHKSKPSKNKRQSSNKKIPPLSSLDRLFFDQKSAPSKPKQVEVPRSPKKATKVPPKDNNSLVPVSSSPPASPRVGKTVKQQPETSPTYTAFPQQSGLRLTCSRLPGQDEDYLICQKVKQSLNIQDEPQKGGSLFVMLAKITGLIFLYYIIVGKTY